MGRDDPERRTPPVPSVGGFFSKLIPFNGTREGNALAERLVRVEERLNRFDDIERRLKELEDRARVVELELKEVTVSKAIARQEQEDALVKERASTDVRLKRWQLWLGVVGILVAIGLGVIKLFDP